MSHAWITIKSYKLRIEAEIDRGVLESHGLKAVIIADDAGGMRPFPLSYSYGVELKVHSKDLEKAKVVLKSSY